MPFCLLSLTSKRSWRVTAIVGDFVPSVRPAKPPLLNGKGNLREDLIRMHSRRIVVTLSPTHTEV